RRSTRVFWEPDMRAHLPTAASTAWLSGLLAIGLLLSPAAVLAQAADVAVPAGQKPVIATGTVPGEATRAAILQRLRELYGANRVVDRMEVDAVIAPRNWRDGVLGMIGPELQKVSAGELAIDGNSVRITGQVGNEAA